MTPRFLLLLAFLMICLAQMSSDTETEQNQQEMVVRGGVNRKVLPFIDCGRLCKVRCGLHSRPNLCKRACGTCCTRCKCVPPGTAGNREMCGTCYTDITTHGNRTKCP